MVKLNARFDKPIEPFGSAAVQAMVRALDKILKPADTTVNVRVCSSKVVQELNKKYAHKDEPTDVLSFNYNEDSKNTTNQTGDMVVSYDHVKEQAQVAGTDQSTELALLILHGILHLLGQDHQNQTQRAKVDQLQAQIMRSAGLMYRDFGWRDA